MAVIFNFKSYNSVVDFDIGVKFCTEGEVCSAKYEGCMKVAIRNKFKKAVVTILNFVLGL